MGHLDLSSSPRPFAARLQARCRSGERRSTLSAVASGRAFLAESMARRTRIFEALSGIRPLLSPRPRTRTKARSNRTRAVRTLQRRWSFFMLRARARSLVTRQPAVTTSGGGSFNQPARVERGMCNPGNRCGSCCSQPAAEAGGRRRAGEQVRGAWPGMICSGVSRSSSGQVLIGGREARRRIRCDSSGVVNSNRKRRNALARCTAAARPC